MPDAQAEYGTVSTGGVRYQMYRRGTVPDVQAEYGTNSTSVRFYIMYIRYREI